MRSLTDGELFEIQQFIERMVQRIEAEGLTVSIDDNLSNFVNHMKGAPDPLGVSATFDPSKANVRPDNSFWVPLKTRKGEIVVSHANRVIDTNDFFGEIRTWRMFSRKPRLDWQPIKMYQRSDVPEISGRVVFGGGMWAHPRWRGKSLSGTLAHFTRSLSLRHFEFDWYVGLMVDNPKVSSYGIEVLGLMHSAPIMAGFYPGRDKELNIRLLYMARDEVLAKIREENASLSAADTQKLSG